MAITLQCPRCTHEQTIDEEKAGTEVPCKVCHHMIKPPAVKPKAKLQASEPAPKKEGVQAGPPPMQAGKTTVLTDKKTKVDDAKTKPAKKRDSDDDDPPKKRPAPRVRHDDPGSSSMMWVLLGGGGFLAVLLLCGGGFGIFFLLGARPAAELEPIALINPVPPVPIEINPPPMPNPNPIVIPNPNPIPFPNPNPFPPAAENLDPGDPNQIARVLQLLSGPAPQREPALTWLANANVNHPRRSEVARGLEGLVDEYQRQPFNSDRFFTPYFKWATKEDNIPSLIRLVDGPQVGGLQGRQRQQAMQLLARFKDPRGAEPIAKQMDNFFQRQDAASALTEMGSIAEAAVLKYFNHPDGNTRDTARRILQGYNTRADVLISQCLADLDATDKNRRNGAVQWLANNPGEQKRRPEVARALNKSIETENFFFNRDLVTALENWATSENVPKLTAILEQNRPGSREAIRILGKIQDPGATKAIAKQLNNFVNSREARNALKGLGSQAEPAVIDVLNTTADPRARRECIGLLGDIGTRKLGLVALQRFQQDPFLRPSVQAAALAINARP